MGLALHSQLAWTGFDPRLLNLSVIYVYIVNTKFSVTGYPSLSDPRSTFTL